VSSNQVHRALELFSQNYNCTQAVYVACAVGEGLSERQRLALAAPFGGGLAQQGEVCGALTGALLALGEADIESVAADPATARLALYAQVQKLMEDFRQAHGSILCRELIGCSFNTEEGLRSFMKRGVRQNICNKLVAFAAEEVVRITAASPQK
jgi:C_GCAxxG_C_C family probable redox protein